MIIRFFAFISLCWFLGFGWFAIALPQPAGTTRTDAVVVLTGAPGRIDRGLEVLRNKWSRRLFVSGVDSEVKRGEFAAQHKVEDRLMQCCVVLGLKAVDTRSNGLETARWVARNDIRSIRLVTTDWHMRRARLELERALPDNVTIVSDGVPSRPTLRTLFKEYHKLLARWISTIIDL